MCLLVSKLPYQVRKKEKKLNKFSRSLQFFFFSPILFFAFHTRQEIKCNITLQVKLYPSMYNGGKRKLWFFFVHIRYGVIAFFRYKDDTEVRERQTAIRRVDGYHGSFWRGKVDAPKHPHWIQVSWRILAKLSRPLSVIRSYRLTHKSDVVFRMKRDIQYKSACKCMQIKTAKSRIRAQLSLFVDVA